MYRKHYVQFLQEDLERHFPQFFLPEFARIVRPGIQLLRESLVLYPSNVFECWIGRDRRHPWRSSKPTVVNKLTPNQLDISTPFDSKHYYMFARNTSTLSAAHSVAEGFIRPSASDPNDSSWTTTNSFYACGQHITDITGPHIREAELVSMLMTAQKYGGAGTSLPLTVVGSALSRHNHFCWQRWECINKLPSTSGNPRHCAVVSVRPHFQSFSHIAFFQSLFRSGNASWGRALCVLL